MAVGTTARKPEGLQISFLEKRHTLTDTTTNGTQFLIGTMPKGGMVVAVYKKEKTAPSGGARQLWIGTSSAKSSLVGAAGIIEGTSTTVNVPTAIKSVNFTQDTDLYLTQTAMTTTKPAGGVLDIAIAYLISPTFAS